MCCPGAKVTLLPGIDTCYKCFPGAEKVDDTTCKCRKGLDQRDDYDCFCPLFFKLVGVKCVKCSQKDMKEAETTEGTTDSSACTICLPGKFHNAKKKKFLKCPAGSTNLGQNLLPNCKTCQVTHLDSKGVKQCGWAPGFGEVKGKCEICPAGTALSGTRCLGWGFGLFYGDVAGLTECKECPEGQRYSSKSRQKTCPPPCPKNSEGIADLGRCICKLGFAHKNKGKVPVCVRCPGTQIPTTLKDKCVCAIGTGIPKRKCVTCRPGTYSDGHAKCKPCYVNSVTPNTGAYFCEDCDTS